MPAPAQMPDLDTQLLTHMLESAALKADVENLRSNQADLTTRVLMSLGELGNEMKGLRLDIQAVPDRIAACRTDMRREVDKDFPNRVDAIEMEKRIEQQVRETDQRLSTQITKVDASAQERHASLKAQVEKVEAKVDRQWVKITTAITVVLVVMGVVVWVIDNVSATVLQDHPPHVVQNGQR